MGNPGRREFIQVLRLMEVFNIGDVAAAQGIFSVLSGDSGSDGQASK